MQKRVLWAARHAPVRVEGLCYGQSEVPTSVPVEQAVSALVDSFSGSPVDIVWSSPASRCKLPAEQLAARMTATHHVSEALYELQFGAWEGRAWSEIATTEAYARWLRDWERVAPPGGETPADLEARVRAWVLGLDPSRAHLLVAHAGVVRALRVILAGCSWREAMDRPVEHLVWEEFGMM